MSRTTIVTCDRCGLPCGADMLVFKPLAGDPTHAFGDTLDLCGSCRGWLSDGLKRDGKPAAAVPEPSMGVVTR